MPIKLKVTTPEPIWLKLIREKQQPVAKAAVEALEQTAVDAVGEGRRNIAFSGHFNQAWQRDLTYKMIDAKVGGFPSLQAKAEVYHKSALAIVFEEGRTIHGDPLLWIPTSPKLPTPSRFVRRGGKLTGATVRGTHMLFDATDRARDRKPLYIGVEQATIPKIWRITEIVEKHAAEIGLLFLKFFKDN